MLLALRRGNCFMTPIIADFGERSRISALHLSRGDTYANASKECVLVGDPHSARKTYPGKIENRGHSQGQADPPPGPISETKGERQLAWLQKSRRSTGLHPWYDGFVSVIAGKYHPSMILKLYFGDEQAWVFSADLWHVGAGLGKGMGAGPWQPGFVAPVENQMMFFEIVSGEVTAQGFRILWRRPDGPYLGSFVGVTQGLGLFSSRGIGTWNRV